MKSQPQLNSVPNLGWLGCAISSFGDSPTILLPLALFFIFVTQITNSLTLKVRSQLSIKDIIIIINLLITQISTKPDRMKFRTSPSSPSVRWVRSECYQTVLSLGPCRSGLDSGQKSRLLLNLTWQCRFKSSSSRFTNRFGFSDSDQEMNRRTSWKRVSSQGMTSGPGLEKPYSSSAWRRSFLKTGWFRYVARTTNLVRLVPTQTATCPAGTSDGMRLADMRALLRQRRSIWRSRTMCRIWLHFADIFFFLYCVFCCVVGVVVLLGEESCSGSDDENKGRGIWRGCEVKVL